MLETQISKLQLNQMFIYANSVFVYLEPCDDNLCKAFLIGNFISKQLIYNKFNKVYEFVDTLNVLPITSDVF